MQLADYLSTKKLSVAAFAKQLGVKRQSIYRYLAGQPPCWEILEDIRTVTDGAVMPNDFLNGGRKG